MSGEHHGGRSVGHRGGARALYRLIHFVAVLDIDMRFWYLRRGHVRICGFFGPENDETEDGSD